MPKISFSKVEKNLWDEQCGAKSCCSLTCDLNGRNNYLAHPEKNPTTTCNYVGECLVKIGSALSANQMRF